MDGGMSASFKLWIVISDDRPIEAHLNEETARYRAGQLDDVYPRVWICEAHIPAKSFPIRYVGFDGRVDA